METRKEMMASSQGDILGKRTLRCQESRGSSQAAKIARIMILLLLSGVITIGMTGCGKTATATKDGNAIKYTYDEIEEDNGSGIYVLNKDKTFSPILSDLPGYAGSTDEASSSRYVWYTNNKTNVTSLIPTVTPGTPLVAIYDSSDDMPDEWYLERYKSKGYTVGMHITLGDDKTMQIEADDALSGSSAESALSSISNGDDTYNVSAISGSSSLPINNVDTNMSILLGFEKNKVYTFEFYQGTKLQKTDIYADTRIFQSTQYISLKDPYKKTSKGYFIINLPLNLEDGYYYLSDIGFFRYSSN